MINNVPYFVKRVGCNSWQENSKLSCVKFLSNLLHPANLILKSKLKELGNEFRT